MRKALLVLAALVAACGDDSNDGGGGLSGSVGGRAFSPVEVRAIPAGSGATPCAVPLGGATVGVGVSALALEVTSYAGACGDFSTAQCRFHQNAQTVLILLAKLKPPSVLDPVPTQPELTPGTYTVTASPTTVTPDGSGLLTVAFAQAFASDATCGGTPSPSVQGGTVRLDQVGDPITGRVSVTFQDGSSLTGDFSAPRCPGVSPDVCALAATQSLCTLPPTCVP